MGLERNDLELVRAAADGDASAFAELVDRHGKDLLRQAWFLSRDEHAAEDIVQETLAGAFIGLARFDGRSSVKTWLSRILMRVAATAWRRSKRMRLAVPLDDAPEPSAQSGTRWSEPSETTAVDKRLDLAEVLQQLSPDHREILILREMRGLSYSEIARELNVPEGTIDSRLYRARGELRRRMNGYLV